MGLFTQSHFLVLNIFVALLSLNVAVSAQSPHTEVIHHECGSEPTLTTINYLQKRQSEINAFEIDYGRSATNQVPVTIHVVRKTDGTGGLTTAQVGSILSDMNATYASANIEFVQCASTDYIDDTQYFYFTQTEETAMSTAHDVPGTLNIYFVGTLQSSNGSFLCGYTYFPQSNKDILIASNSCATNGSTIVHELGHFFGLYHTHGKSNSGTSDELSNGTNCIFAGDDVCDTPADPNLNGLVNVQCEYIGSATDAMGMPYDPDTDNIMSYAPTQCRVAFSDGQLQRIGYINQTEKGHLNCNGLTADFTASQTVGHCGQNMVVDFTYTGGNATSWAWDINNDGTIDYTSQNPTHNYTADGEYEVSLTVSDGANSLSKNFPIIIKRLETHVGTFTDDFDGSLANWGIEDEDMGNRWDQVTNYQYSNNTIMCINNYTDNPAGQLDCLTSKNIDLSALTNPTLEFDLSYQPKSIYYTDILKVEISSDCGATYDVLYEKTGLDLSTTGTTGFLKWQPTSTNDWRQESINLAAYAGETIHIRFVNQSGQGNYLYLDAVNVVEGSALPVEWESISVNERKGGAMVNWEVSDMVNHSHFEVEHSRDGLFFEKIGIVKEIAASGNYSWIDNAVSAGINYYRIKQLDLDGAVDYSKVVSIESSVTQSLSIYPTLVQNEINVKNSSAEATHIEYTIYEVSSKVLKKGVIDQDNTINLSTLEKGIYWINLKAGATEKTERFVKI